MTRRRIPSQHIAQVAGRFMQGRPVHRAVMARLRAARREAANRWISGHFVHVMIAICMAVGFAQVAIH